MLPLVWLLLGLLLSGSKPLEWTGALETASAGTAVARISMALDPVVNQLREIAISGSATLADIPFLAQRLKQGQTGQFGRTSPGLPSEEAGRGGPGLGAGLFEPPPAQDISAGGGGGGEPVQLNSLESFAEAFSPTGRPPNFGGRGGADTESGNVSVSDFDPTSEIGLALSAFGKLTGIPAADITNALSEAFGPFGVIGPSRPTIGTQAFSDVVEAGKIAAAKNDRIAAAEKALGRGLTAAEKSIAEADFEAGFDFSDPGFASAAQGNTGGPAEGSGAGGVGQAAAGGQGSSRDAPGNTGGGVGGTSGGGAGGGGGGGDSGGGAGGAGGGGPGGGAGEGRHVGGIVSEDERPGITAGDVPNQLLQEGEFIVRREAVQNIGEPFMDALNILAANFDPKQTRNALRELLK